MSLKAAETSSQPAPAVILYFSGVGGTKMIAELLGRLLAQRIASGCEVHSIEEDRAAEAAARAGFLVPLLPDLFSQAGAGHEGLHRESPAGRAKAARLPW